MVFVLPSGTAHTRERMPEDAGPCLILTHGAGCLGPRSVEPQTSAVGQLSGNVGTCWGVRKIALALPVDSMGRQIVGLYGYMR